jgi:hypothetical protein
MVAGNPRVWGQSRVLVGPINANDLRGGNAK